DTGFPQAETFLWRRITGEKFLTSGHALERFRRTTTRAFTPQYLFYQWPVCTAEQRLHTNRTNRTLPSHASDPSSETGDYKGVGGLCQGKVQQKCSELLG